MGYVRKYVWDNHCAGAPQPLSIGRAVQQGSQGTAVKAALSRQLSRHSCRAEPCVRMVLLAMPARQLLQCTVASACMGGCSR